jgi:glucan phosphorylase
MSSDFQDQMLKLISNMDQTVNSLAQTVTSFNQTLNSHFQSIARIKVQFEQIANQIEEEELQSQPMANLDELYMVDESTSYHEQAITTRKNGEFVETHVKNRKEAQIKAPQALHWTKGEEVSTEAPSSSTLILKMPYEPRAPIPVHDSLPDEKLFENTQRDLPRYANIQNYRFCR